MRGTYVHVSYPWRARIDTRSPYPRAYYAALIGQGLRYGMPARRRAGRLLAFIGRRGVPEGMLARAFQVAPRVEDPTIDNLRGALAERWDDVAGRCRSLPSTAPELSVLALERSAGLTVFFFGAAATPLVVAKCAIRAEDALRREAEILRLLEGVAVAPKDLGSIEEARLQEALAGAPLKVPPLTPAQAGRLVWPADAEELGRGLTRLAEATATDAAPRTLADRLFRAQAYDDLGARARRLLAAAWQDVRRMNASVVRHRDTSPQNCLFDGPRLSGIVDWELAEVCGAPGFDVWNAAISYVEHGLGLVRWSQELAFEALARSWDASPFWARARAVARESATAAGASDSLLDPLELVFFGSRLGDRLAAPHIRRGTTLSTSARMLEFVASAS